MYIKERITQVQNKYETIKESQKKEQERVGKNQRGKDNIKGGRMEMIKKYFFSLRIRSLIQRKWKREDKIKMKKKLKEKNKRQLDSSEEC